MAEDFAYRVPTPKAQKLKLAFHNILWRQFLNPAASESGTAPKGMCSWILKPRTQSPQRL